MRFLLLTQYFEPEVGASQVRLSALCRELLAEGHEVEVVTAMPHHPFGRIFPEYRGRFYLRETRDGLALHRVWLFVTKKSGTARILNYLSFAFLCLFALVRAKKPDYVFVDSPPLFLTVPAWISARMWNSRLIFNVADLWPDSVLDLGVMQEGMATKLGFALEKWAYERADFVTAVTEGIRHALLDKKRLPPHKILFLPNGVDTALFRPQPPDEQLRSQLKLTGKKIVLYAGNHGYAGAVDQLVEAASLVEDPDVHFVLIGDGPEKPKLIELTGKLGLKNITFLDSVPLQALPAYLSITDIAAVTLRRSRITEGARPAKGFVMMAAGKPLVLAAEGESARLIRDAKAGLVVPPHSPRELANAILRLVRNPQEAAALGANGRRLVRAEFDWALLVRNWLADLERTVPQHNTVSAARNSTAAAPASSTAPTPTSSTEGI